MLDAERLDGVRVGVDADEVGFVAVFAVGDVCTEEGVGYWVVCGVCCLDVLGVIVVPAVTVLVFVVDVIVCGSIVSSSIVVLVAVVDGSWS